MEKILKEIDIKEESVSLKYGAIISLKHLYNGQYIYVEGFINTLPHLLDCEKMEETKNFNKCLFQIFPSFINTFKTESTEFDKKMKLPGS